MVALRIFSAIAAAIASPGLILLGNTASFRSIRLRVLLGKPIAEFNPIGAPFIPKASFVSDIESSIMTSHGVKVLWAPPGAGKSTTVRKVLIKMKEMGQIRGSIVVIPPDLNSMPSVWFRSALHDAFGELLRPGERLSQILPKSDGRPYVFVFDQVDSVPYGVDMRRFIAHLAEDSELTRSYVVLVLTNDSSNAKTMWEWNGHEKIVLMSDLRFKSPLEYRWNEEDVEKWLVKYIESNEQSALQEGSILRNILKVGAITAGTPGFLIETVKSLDAGPYDVDVIKNRASYISEQWKFGANELR